MLFNWLVPERINVLLLSARSRRLSHARLRAWGMPEVNDKLIKVFGNQCENGLFPGMILPNFLRCEQMGPFLLGTYEQEIEPWLTSLKTQRFSTILDIGSKFGFYAVGLAQWFPTTRVIAFDTDPWAQKATREVANVNKVHNVETLGYCSHKWLASHLPPDSLIISDCEGYEFILFQPESVPNLNTATMIIESHDAPPWEKHAKLIESFQYTHDVKEVSFDTSDRSKRTTFDLSFLSPSELGLAVGEPRNPWQKWLYFRPKLANSL